MFNAFEGLGISEGNNNSHSKMLSKRGPSIVSI